MLCGAGVFYDVPDPGCVGVVIRIRVLPPPHLVPLVVASKDNIKIAIAVDVVERATRLDSKVCVVDNIFRPAGG